MHVDVLKLSGNLHMAVATLGLIYDADLTPMLRHSTGRLQYLSNLRRLPDTSGNYLAVNDLKITDCESDNHLQILLFPPFWQLTY